MSLEVLKAAVIITAAGSSLRMGIGNKKEFLKLDGQMDGQSVLLKSVEPFVKSKLFIEYVIVLQEKEIEKGETLLSSLLSLGNFNFVSGGETRQESVCNGLLALKHKALDIVLIHDGARPWITEEVINKVLMKAVKTGAAIPVVPSVNAMKTINTQGIIISDLNRKFTVSAQTPQGFIFNKILTSHETARHDNLEYIDDAEIYSRYAGAVVTVPGATANRKITYLSDMEGK